MFTSGHASSVTTEVWLSCRMFRIHENSHIEGLRVTFHFNMSRKRKFGAMRSGDLGGHGDNSIFEVAGYNAIDVSNVLRVFLEVTTLWLIVIRVIKDMCQQCCSRDLKVWTDKGIWASAAAEREKQCCNWRHHNITTKLHTNYFYIISKTLMAFSVIQQYLHRTYICFAKVKRELV